MSEPVFTTVTPREYARALQAYRALNDSPLQRRWRKAHPLHVGAVYWDDNWPGREKLLYELKRIRKTGFTFVRFHFDHNEPKELSVGKYDFSRVDMWMDAAQEAGLGVYLHIHLEAPSRAALEAEGLTWAEAQARGAADSQVREAIRVRLEPLVEHYRGHPALWVWPTKGEPGAAHIPLESDYDAEQFLRWLKRHYASPAELNRTWAIYPNRQPVFIASWDDALRVARTIKQSEGHALATTGCKHEVYGTMRDLMRFRADWSLACTRAAVAMVHTVDPIHPVLVGNHQLFINNPQLGWDVLGSGRLADGHFSSIHLSWHFEQSEGEVDRPVYMQARFTKDACKGGVTSAYETTGGPVQYSGGYGNHMDEGLMRRLMFSYLAAGNETIAFWDWLCRPGGIEVGEYGLATLSGKVSRWAKEAGRVIAAMGRFSNELWHAWEPPELGLIRCWDTEAILNLEPRRFDTETGPSDFSRGPRQQHMRALIGASRAAVDAQVAFEYLTDPEIAEGIAGVYPALYLPHVRACSDELFAQLLEYVRAGGRLIADVQAGFLDPWGKLRQRGKGALIERLFGAWVDSIHDARTHPLHVDGAAVQGFYGDIELTTARVLRRFSTGQPAVTEARIGAGRAILIGFDPARECWRPGNTAMQALLADLYRGNAPRRWWSDAPLVFRRAHAKADHWFFVNDGPARSAVLRVYDREYRRGMDALTGTPVATDGTISVELPEQSGVWLRLERAQ